MTDLGRIADQLETIVADLDEVAFDRLREASAEGVTSRPADDRELVPSFETQTYTDILRSLDDT